MITIIRLYYLNNEFVDAQLQNKQLGLSLAHSFKEKLERIDCMEQSDLR